MVPEKHTEGLLLLAGTKKCHHCARTVSCQGMVLFPASLQNEHGQQVTALRTDRHKNPQRDPGESPPKHHACGEETGQDKPWDGALGGVIPTRGWGEAVACKSCWGGSFGSGRVKTHTEERHGERALPAGEQQLHHYPNTRWPAPRSTWLQIRGNCDHERRGTASQHPPRHRQRWHRPDKMAFTWSVYLPPLNRCRTPRNGLKPSSLAPCRADRPVWEVVTQLHEAPTKQFPGK